MRNIFILMFITLFSMQTFADTNKIEQSVITVKGKSELDIPADQAELLIVAEIIELTPQLAETKGYEVGLKLKTVLKKFGITEDSIKSTKVGIDNDGSYRNKQKVIKSKFRLSYTLVFDRFDLIDDLRKECIDSGVTRFKVTKLHSNKLSEYTTILKQRAFQSAKKNAEDIIEGSGLKLGKPLLIQSSKSFIVEDLFSRNDTDGLGAIQESRRVPLFQQKKIHLEDVVDVKFMVE